MVLRSLDTLGGTRRWILVVQVVEDLELKWRGRGVSVAQILIYARDQGWVRSRHRPVLDPDGNARAGALEWRITPKGRRVAWR